MAGACASATLPAEMEAAPRIRVVLELIGTRQPLAGELIACDGTVAPFLGWLEFAAVIERARLQYCNECEDAATASREER